MVVSGWNISITEHRTCMKISAQVDEMKFPLMHQKNINIIL